LGEAVVVYLLDEKFDMAGIDFLFLQKLLLVDCVLLSAQFVAAGHTEQF
jgi:hypothetical protein